MLKIYSAEDYIKKLKDRGIKNYLSIQEPVYQIIQNVISRGDDALLQYAQSFDQIEDIKDFRIRCSEEEKEQGISSLPNDMKDIIDEAYENIYTFHSKELQHNWSFSKDGAYLGQLISPIEKIGAYVPGGKGTYPSTVLMNCIPAQIAGVPEIYITTPPTPIRGHLDPAILYAGSLCGVKEFYKIGGAGAIAALTYGTKSVKKVYKIVGPGNLFVSIAKKLVYGHVDIDMIAGPSEIMILADENSPIDYITYDLFSQSEHSEDSSSILLVPNEKMAHEVISFAKKKVKASKRKYTLERALEDNGVIAIYSSLREAFDIINEYAPEHLGILMDINIADIAKYIKNVGSIFMGANTPEPIGDYFAGTNHSLPTGGTAKFFSPLGVYDFQKRTSITCYSKELLEKNKDKIIRFAEYEGFFEHANSIRIRCDNTTTK